MFDLEKSTKLLEYLPKYYEENLEMNNITNTEDIELNSLWKDVVTVLNNQFIQNADEFTIRKWERLLKLRPNLREDDLERRKSVILLKLATKPPITYRWLENKLEETAGKDNYVIELDNNKYYLKLRINNNSGVVPTLDLVNYIRVTIPSNIALDLVEEMEINIPEEVLYLSGNVEVDKSYVSIFKNEIEDMKFSKNIYIGSNVDLDRSYVNIANRKLQDMEFNTTTYISTGMLEISSFFIPTNIGKKLEVEVDFAKGKTI